MAPSAIDVDGPQATFQIHEPSTNAETKSAGGALHVARGTNDRLASKLVGEALRRRVDGVDHDVCDPGDEDPFFVADVGEVYRQHLRWKLNLPRVRPFYAVKCNPDPQVLRLLAELGTGFDCASKQEIQQVLDTGVDPSRILYAQPCKTNSYVRYAAQRGVKQMTFDNAEELYKIKRHFPAAELYLRIQTDDSSSLCRLSLKFGASLRDTEALLKLAKQLGLDVVGVSFHVGSGATDPHAFVRAIQDARLVFDQAHELGYSLRTLDVGGGFGNDTFDVMAAVIGRELDDCFPQHVQVIGEPGRYYVSHAFRLACHVIARRTLEDPASREQSYMLYVNDGVYGNFSSIMFDHQQPVPRILRCRGRFMYGVTGPERDSGERTPYSVWGPTCDGIDCIAATCTLPAVLDVGDWLYFEDMGAYTMCSATRFNGFTDAHDVIYVSSEPGASALLGMD
ncbi:MAG: Ornithine decarboxylase [Lichina confinis]|nr:MAG: Ornithine decarboxylase [Lichina confinis]